MRRQTTISEDANKVTGVAYRLLDALILRNPERTAIGVALGVALYGVLNVVQPALVGHGMDLARLDWVASACIGLVIVHLPFVIWSVRHRPVISDELEDLIQLIESTNVGQLERRMAYRKLINKCIDELSLSARPGTMRGEIRSEIDEIRSETE
jgi:hypothetical protein